MADGEGGAPQHNPVLEALKAELVQVDPEATPYVHSVIDHEIRKLSQESVMKGPPPNQEYIELNEKSRIKLMHKIYVPVDRYPGFNFVGKILGNKGENLKKIALETKTRIAIMGQGSAKKNTNVQELIESGDPTHLHLKEPLHVRVESYGGCQHVWANMAKAMEALMPFMTPDETYTPPAPAYGYGAYDPYGAYPAYPEHGYPPPGQGFPGGRGMRGRGRGEAPFRGGRGRGAPRGRGGFGGGLGGGFGGENGANGFGEEMDSSFGEGYQQAPSFGKSRPPGRGAPRGMLRGRGDPRGRGRGVRGRPY